MLTPSQPPYRSGQAGRSSRDPLPRHHTRRVAGGPKQVAGHRGLLQSLGGSHDAQERRRPARPRASRRAQAARRSGRGSSGARSGDCLGARVSERDRHLSRLCLRPNAYWRTLSASSPQDGSPISPWSGRLDDVGCRWVRRHFRVCKTATNVAPPEDAPPKRHRPPSGASLVQALSGARPARPRTRPCPRRQGNALEVSSLGHDRPGRVLGHANQTRACSPTPKSAGVRSGEPQVSWMRWRACRGNKSC
jgi:hypothetical protein